MIYIILWYRLACHSCDPNTEVVTWKVEGLDCLAMYSVREIKANESITFDHSAQIQVWWYVVYNTAEAFFIILNFSSFIFFPL